MKGREIQLSDQYHSMGERIIFSTNDAETTSQPHAKKKQKEKKKKERK